LFSERIPVQFKSCKNNLKYGRTQDTIAGRSIRAGAGDIPWIFAVLSPSYFDRQLFFPGFFSVSLATSKIVAALHRKVLFSSFYLLWTLLRILSSNPKVKTTITDGSFDSESKMVGNQTESETCVLGFLKRACC